MYYHVLIEINEKLGKLNKRYFELDKTDLQEIKNDIITPFLNGIRFQFNGYFLNQSNITRIVVKQSAKTAKEYYDYEKSSNKYSVFLSQEDMLDYDNYMTDITKDTFSDVKNELTLKKTSPQTKKEFSNELDNTKIFIVHGQDETAKLDLARFIEKIGFEAIILHEQVSSGKTIIEKIEDFSNVGFGIVLYTPCDVGFMKGYEQNKKTRARQNVVFEHGYLMAKLGRKNVCALVKENVEIPNDISGVVYVPMDEHKAWKFVVAKELKNAGYNVDMNKL